MDRHNGARPQADRSPDKPWYLVSSHGALLFWIAANPECTVEQAAEALCLTPRTIWGIVGDLRRAGMLDVRRQGKRHYYTVNMDGRFRHPVLPDYPLSVFLTGISSAAEQQAHGS